MKTQSINFNDENNRETKEEEGKAGGYEKIKQKIMINRNSIDHYMVLRKEQKGGFFLWEWVIPDDYTTVVISFSNRGTCPCTGVSTLSGDNMP